MVPFVFCLLPNKTEETYQRALTAVLNAVDEERRPMMIIIDFEKATENAIRAILPLVDIHGCWFHFNQVFIIKFLYKIQKNLVNMAGDSK